MADKTWKAVERRVAKLFGAERNPLSGKNSKQKIMVTTELYIFEELGNGK